MRRTHCKYTNYGLDYVQLCSLWIAITKSNIELFIYVHTRVLC